MPHSDIVATARLGRLPDISNIARREQSIKRSQCGNTLTGPLTSTSLLRRQLPLFVLLKMACHDITNKCFCNLLRQLHKRFFGCSLIHKVKFQIAHYYRAAVVRAALAKFRNYAFVLKHTLEVAETVVVV